MNYLLGEKIYQHTYSQKFGNNKVFERSLLMLTKAACIWSKYSEILLHKYYVIAKFSAAITAVGVSRFTPKY